MEVYLKVGGAYLSESSPREGLIRRKGLNQVFMVSVYLYFIATYTSPFKYGVFKINFLVRSLTICFNLSLFSVDIWSVGCIMAELLTSKVLFPGGDRIHFIADSLYKAKFAIRIDLKVTLLQSNYTNKQR